MTRWAVPSIPHRPRARSRPATPIEIAVLDALRRAQGEQPPRELSTTQVADKIDRSMARASRVLHRLKTAGLVTCRAVADRTRVGVTWVMWRIKPSV